MAQVLAVDHPWQLRCVPRDARSSSVPRSQPGGKQTDAMASRRVSMDLPIYLLEKQMQIRGTARPDPVDLGFEILAKHIQIWDLRSLLGPHPPPPEGPHRIPDNSDLHVFCKNKFKSHVSGLSWGPAPLSLKWSGVVSGRALLPKPQRPPQNHVAHEPVLEGSFEGYGEARERQEPAHTPIFGLLTA